jgi:steroid delta-isomerase-like uncharacterized protein
MDIPDQPGHDLNQILTELLEAWNAHNAECVASFYSADYVGVDVSESGQQRGPEGVRHTVQRYLNAFSDLHLTQEETVVNDNRAAIKVTVRGTYQGGLMNIPATGRTTELHGVAFLTFDNGKITRASYLWDVAGFLRNIGLLPDL